MSTPDGPVVFMSGERLDLCPMRKDDAHLYELWLNDADVSSTLMMHRPLSHEEELKLLGHIMAGPTEKGFAVGIWTRDPSRLIGNIGLHEISARDQHGMLGIFLGDKTQWGKGYGQEACELLLTYAFESMNLRKVWLFHYDHNHRARHLYDALGFVEVCCQREQSFIGGTWRDVCWMELFRDDFRERTGS